MREASSSVTSHLLIAGTGRAGTSFLVRYLTGVGLDTTLSRRGDEAFWDEDANAGLEENAAESDWSGLPYVVKTPWLHQLIDEILSRPDIKIDAVVVPIRDLVEAAASRVISELRAMHHDAPWMAELAHGWEVWGTTPGGIVYSLSPLDQARLLAISFHRLLERLAQADIPVVLVAFPRLAQDADYLFRRLQTVLPPGTTAEKAGEVHRSLADASKIRVASELDGTLAATPSCSAEPTAYPESERLHRIALGRELGRVRRALADANAALQAAIERKAGYEPRSWRLTDPVRAASAALRGLFR